MVSARKVTNDDPSGAVGSAVPRTWEDGAGDMAAMPSEVLKSVAEQPSSVSLRGRYWDILSGFRHWPSLPEAVDVKGMEGVAGARGRSRGCPDAGRPGRGGPLPRPPPVTGVRSPDLSQKVKTVPLPPSMAHELEKVWA